MPRQWLPDATKEERDIAVTKRSPAASRLDSISWRESNLARIDELINDMKSEILALGKYYAKICEASAQFSALLQEANEEARYAGLPGAVTETFEALAETTASIGDAVHRDLTVNSSIEQMDIQRRIAHVLNAHVLFVTRWAAGDSDLMDVMKCEQRRLEEMEQRHAADKKNELFAALTDNMRDAIETKVQPSVYARPRQYWRKMFPDYFESKLELHRTEEYLRQAEKIKIASNNPDAQKLMDLTRKYRDEVRRTLSTICSSRGQHPIFPVASVDEALQEFGGGESTRVAISAIERAARGPYPIEGIWIRDTESKAENMKETRAIALAIWQLGCGEEDNSVRILHLGLEDPRYKECALMECDAFFTSCFPIDSVHWDMDAEESSNASSDSDAC